MATKLLLRCQIGFFFIALGIVVGGGHLITAALFGGMSIMAWLAAWVVWFVYE